MGLELGRKIEDERLLAIDMTMSRHDVEAAMRG